jgi:hypothetical protein
MYDVPNVNIGGSVLLFLAMLSLVKYTFALYMMLLTDKIYSFSYYFFVLKYVPNVNIGENVLPFSATLSFVKYTELLFPNRPWVTPYDDD